VVKNEWETIDTNEPFINHGKKVITHKSSSVLASNWLVSGWAGGVWRNETNVFNARDFSPFWALKKLSWWVLERRLRRRAEVRGKRMGWNSTDALFGREGPHIHTFHMWCSLSRTPFYCCSITCLTKQIRKHVDNSYCMSKHIFYHNLNETIYCCNDSMWRYTDVSSGLFSI